MICHFTGQPCVYVKCPTWDEGRQVCLWRLAILRFLELPAEILGKQPPLNDTEREILGLMAAGRQNSQIAEDLKIPAKRLSRLIADILVRLDAKNRAHAVSIALQRSIITLPEDHAKER